MVMPATRINKLCRVFSIMLDLNEYEVKVAVNSSFLSYKIYFIFFKLRIIKMSFYFFIIFHCVACGWISFGYALGFGINDWAPPAHIENLNDFAQYAFALYFALNSIAEMGETGLPQTVGQQLFSVICTMVGIFAFAWVVGSFDGIYYPTKYHQF